MSDRIGPSASGPRLGSSIARLVAIAGFMLPMAGLQAQQGQPSTPSSLPPPSAPGVVPVGTPAPLPRPANGDPPPLPAIPLPDAVVSPTRAIPPGSVQQAVLVSSSPFAIAINPNTPVKELLPTPPRAPATTGPVLTDDLTKVPEAEFQQRPEAINPTELTKQTAHQIAKINHLNAKKTDAFMAALLENREDLAGLPFTMGDDCRSAGERTKQFTAAVQAVRQALAQSQQGMAPNAAPSLPGQALIAREGFWAQYVYACNQEDTARSRVDKALAEHVTVARIAALTQMLAVESPEVRLGLVRYLSGIAHVDATKALARMAVFSAEDDIRQAAVDALKTRREKDYTGILLKGLHYPWPAVAKRSADAIARLGRSDLIPDLIALLEEADPRMPHVKEVGGKSVTVVREMVKVNHHRNCMMCHSPGTPGTVSAEAITAEVPVQGQPLRTVAQGYGQSTPDLLIRVDVTYLRQDFSAVLTVGNAHPWPELQRFDFLVRERKLTASEAEAYRERLTPKEPGVLSPYHRAALTALRELTGKDTAPTAEAWRKLLGQSTKTDEVKTITPAG